jgi:hypothetical protein
MHRASVDLGGVAATSPIACTVGCTEHPGYWQPRYLTSVAASGASVAVCAAHADRAGLPRREVAPLWPGSAVLPLQRRRALASATARRSPGDAHTLAGRTVRSSARLGSALSGQHTANPRRPIHALSRPNSSFAERLNSSRSPRSPSLGANSSAWWLMHKPHDFAGILQNSKLASPPSCT